MLISLLKSIVCLCFIISLWLLPFFRNNVIRHFQLLERYLAKNEKTIALVALTLYICVTIFLQFHHPLDGDETQAWFITRDAPSLSKMYTQMGYEGSPGLWHTILFPLAKAGMPFYVMYFLNHLFAITAVLLWLRFAPFPFVVRLLFPFIHIFLTEYSINARSYALSICLLFTGLTLYKKQYDKWLLWSFVLLLFANTNIPAALLACGFTLFLFFNWIFLKNKTDGKAILLIAAGIILVFIQVYPPKDLAHDLASIKLQTTVSQITSGVITGDQTLSIFIYLALIAYAMLCFKNKFTSYALLATQLALFFLFLFKYPGALRHHFYLILSILMFFWVGNIKDNKRNELNILVLAIFLLMFTTSISWTISNVKSYSVWKKEMANYINKKIQPDSNTFIACHPGNLSLSILPYIYTRLMYLTDENRWGSYTIWNQKLVSGSFNPGIVRNVAELSEEHRGYKDYYYLTINELQQDSAKYYDIELLKKTNNPHPANNTSKWATIYLYRLPKYQHSRDR